MENGTEIKLNVVSRKAEFSALFKRKLFSCVVPFIIALGVEIIVQILLVLYPAKIFTTPFFSEPVIILVFFIVTGYKFKYTYQHNYGSTRTQNYLSSYAVAAIYSAIMSFFAVAVAIILHWAKFNDRYTPYFFITADDIVNNLIHGVVLGLLMFSLSSIFMCFKYKNHILFTIIAAVFVLAVPLILFAIFGMDATDYYNVFEKDKIFAWLAYLFIFLAVAAWDYFVQTRDIR